MVDVTTEALQTVKNALSTFQSDIDGLSIRAVSDSDDITEDCNNHIKQTKEEITQVEMKIMILNNQIADLEEKLEQATSQYNALLISVQQIENNIYSLNSKILTLNSQIVSLRSQLANAEDDECQQIQDQINALNYQVSQCEAERSHLDYELKSSEQCKVELQQIINSTKSKKSQCESELYLQKKRCNKMKDKLERLNVIYSRIESDLNAYVVATKKFENQALGKTQKNLNSVDKCIEHIEQYLSISCSKTVSNSSVSGSYPTSGISHSTEILSCAPGEYHYESGTNNTRHAFGQLKLVDKSDRHRSQSAQSSAGGTRRRYDDDGGHLIGARFGGAPNSENLFPQNLHLNRSGYRSLESQWANLLNNNCQVFVDIYTSASSDQMREDAIYGSYTVISPTGDRYTECFSFANENTETQNCWEEDVFANS